MCIRDRESVTEKETGNAQPGACVDVLPRCFPRYGSVMNVSGEFTVFAVFIDALFVSVVNFRLFVVWNKPKNIG